jgi:hypothetical protein
MNSRHFYSRLLNATNRYSQIEHTFLSAICITKARVAHSPVSWIRPTFRLTTTSWVSWWWVRQRYDRIASLAVMLRIISSPEGSMWYFPSENDRQRNILNILYCQFYRVLTMVYCTWKNRVFGLCPSSNVSKNTAFGKMDVSVLR